MVFGKRKGRDVARPALPPARCGAVSSWLENESSRRVDPALPDWFALPDWLEEPPRLRVGVVAIPALLAFAVLTLLIPLLILLVLRLRVAPWARRRIAVQPVKDTARDSIQPMASLAKLDS